MAETDQGDETSSPAAAESNIHLIIKTAKDKEAIDINPDATIQDVRGSWMRYPDEHDETNRRHDCLLSFSIHTRTQLKKKVAEKFSTELECVCLIFAGKILKDSETLETHSKCHSNMHIIKAADANECRFPTTQKSKTV